MAFKRIIFSLLYHQGSFVQSRNFKKQKVGNWAWLMDKYKLLEALKSLDELVILNIDQSDKGFEEVLLISKELAQLVNLPITLGGGIKNLDMANRAFQSGADKLILNSLFFRSPNEFNTIVEKYGSQAVVLNLDYKVINGERFVFSEGGSYREGRLINVLNVVSNFRFGELLLRNIDKDGTGFGNDIEVFDVVKSIDKPILIAGGTGKAEHVIESLSTEIVDGIVTANILNFIGSGLIRLRRDVMEHIHLAKW